jgi:hypothetical protein
MPIITNLEELIQRYNKGERHFIAINLHDFGNCSFENARGADLIDLAGNTLQDVTLPNGKIVDKQIFDSFD